MSGAAPAAPALNGPPAGPCLAGALRAGVGHVGGHGSGGVAHHREEDGGQQDHAEPAGHDPGGPLARRQAGCRRAGAADRWAGRTGGRTGPGATARPGSRRRCAPRGSRRRRCRSCPRRRCRRPGRRKGRRSSRQKRTPMPKPGKGRPGPYPTTTPGISFSGHRASFPRHLPGTETSRHGARQAAVERRGRTPQPRQLPDRPQRGPEGGPARGLEALRRRFHAAAVHRHHGHQQERRGAAQPVRQGARRGDHVRRVLDRGVRADRGVGHAAQARSRHLPDPPVRRRGRPGGAAPVRHLHARTSSRSPGVRA